MNTRLKPPYFLRYQVTELAPGQSAITRRRSASKSNHMCCEARSKVSRRSDRPLEQLKRSEPAVASTLEAFDQRKRDGVDVLLSRADVNVRLAGKNIT